MHVERAIYLTAAAGSAILLILTARYFKACRFWHGTIALVGIVMLHFVGGTLAGPRMRGYLYQDSASNATFVEAPFKGVSYDRMLQHHRDKIHGELYRTFEKDRWNYYRWRDYATHPRWKLRYRPLNEEPRPTSSN